MMRKISTRSYENRVATTESEVAEEGFLEDNSAEPVTVPEGGAKGIPDGGSDMCKCTEVCKAWQVWEKTSTVGSGAGEIEAPAGGSWRPDCILDSNILNRGLAGLDFSLRKTSSAAVLSNWEIKPGWWPRSSFKSRVRKLSSRQWLGAGRMRSDYINGSKGFCRGDGNVLKLNCGDGCKTLNVLKVIHYIKGANFIVCTLYL